MLKVNIKAFVSCAPALDDYRFCRCLCAIFALISCFGVRFLQNVYICMVQFARLPGGLRRHLRPDWASPFRVIDFAFEFIKHFLFRPENAKQVVNCLLFLFIVLTTIFQLEHILLFSIVSCFY